MAPPKYSDFTLVLPTLNEGKNLGRLLSAVLSLYPGISVIVVDDGSTDGTQEIAGSFDKKGVRLISRTGPRGLTASVIDGILASKTHYVVVMDADFQHPPDKIGGIAALLMSGADIAVGCRNPIKGWRLDRRLMSQGASILARASLALGGKPSCSDVLSGFFGVRGELARAVISDGRNRFQMDGYKVLYDLLKCAPNSARVGEVKYDFGMRGGGASKIGLRHVIAFLLSLLK